MIVFVCSFYLFVDRIREILWRICWLDHCVNSQLEASKCRWNSMWCICTCCDEYMCHHHNEPSHNVFKIFNFFYTCRSSTNQSFILLYLSPVVFTIYYFISGSLKVPERWEMLSGLIFSEGKIPSIREWEMPRVAWIPV